MTTITCAYQGGLRCIAKHEPSGTDLLTDAPTDNQGKGESFSPTDLVATALVSCLLTIMGIVAARHGIDLGPCDTRVEKTMTNSGERRIALLEAWITLPPSLEDKQRRILMRAAEGCPVKRSLEGATPIRLHWQ